MKKLIAILAIVFCTSAAFAQLQYSAHIAGNMPLGDFGRSSGDTWSCLNGGRYAIEGNAAFGFGVGAKVKYSFEIEDLAVDALGAIATVDMFYNFVDDDFSYFQKEDHYSIDAPQYINIPIMVGANYKMDMTSSIALYFEAALGLNIRIIGDYEAHGYDNDCVFSDLAEYYKVTREYDPSCSFAFQLGVGAVFLNKFSAGLHYYYLGGAQVHYDYYKTYPFYDDNHWNSVKTSNKLKTNMLVLRLGYHF